MEGVEGITGLKINYYAMVNLQGFRSMVQAVGGLTLNVRDRIPIGGVGGPVTGHIEPGVQQLNGFETLWFARSRESADDYSRMARQKCVMNAMLQQLSPTTVVTKFEAIADASEKLVTTDLPASELGTLRRAGDEGPLPADPHGLLRAAGDQHRPTPTSTKIQSMVQTAVDTSEGKPGSPADADRRRSAEQEARATRSAGSPPSAARSAACSDRVRRQRVERPVQRLLSASAHGAIGRVPRCECPVSARVVAVVVTWNRRDLLRGVAGGARRPRPCRRPRSWSWTTRPPTAPPSCCAATHADLQSCTSPRNTGGAGGFAAGIERALTHEPDLVWLLDDDTVPTADRGRAAGRRLVGVPGAGGRARRAGQPGGLDRRPRPPDEHPARQARRLGGRAGGRRARSAAVPIRSASFVSVMCDAARGPRARPAGRRLLPVERRLRVLHPAAPRPASGLAVPDSVVVHKTRTSARPTPDPGERFFFEVRNKVWLFSRSTGSRPDREGCCTAARPLRRWVRTFARSADRRTLARGLRRGLAAGLDHPARGPTASCSPRPAGRRT